VAAGTGTGTAATDEAGRWDCDGTPSGTKEEHCQTELLWPSSSWLLVCADHIIRDDDITDKLWE
jgi:hypothetical protein